MKKGHLRGALTGLVLGTLGFLGYRLLDKDSEINLNNDLAVERVEYPVEIRRSSETERMSSRPYQEETNINPKKERELISEKIPSLEKVLSQYVPRNWVEEERAFYMTAVEQLTGGTGVYGLVKLFEDLRLEDSSIVEGKRVWNTKGGKYVYHKTDGRHHLEVKSDDGTIGLKYQIMTDDSNSLSAVIGERWKGNKDALSYTIHPGQVRYDQEVTLGASKYTGRVIFGQPLWEDWAPRNEYDNPKTSGDALSVLRNKRVDYIFSKFK